MTTRLIQPPEGPFETVVEPPGSKSHTIRALFLAALARGESRVAGGLDSDDTRRARECLIGLGVSVTGAEGVWIVDGRNGVLEPSPLPLDVGESGLTARFLLAIAGLVPGRTVVTGRGRLPERPMDSVLDALETQGAVVGRSYPWEVTGNGTIPGGRLVVDGTMSSQSVSALLLVAPMAKDPVLLQRSGHATSSGYIDMTLEMMGHFGSRSTELENGWEIAPTRYTATDLTVPIDASAMVYPAAAAAITGGSATIVGDPGHHPDVGFLSILERMGCDRTDRPPGVLINGPDRLSGGDFDMESAPDAAVALAVLCSVARGRSRISGLASLRHKESDRLAALQSELSLTGAEVTVEGSTMIIDPSDTAGDVILSSHGDHRLAMSLALLGLVRPGVAVSDSEAVSKTWPGFWEWLETTGAGVSVI